MTALQTAWSAVRTILVVTFAIAASLSALWWALLRDSWIDASAFSAGMQLCLFLAAAGVIISGAVLFRAAVIGSQR